MGPPLIRKYNVLAEVEGLTYNNILMGKLCILFIRDVVHILIHKI